MKILTMICICLLIFKVLFQTKKMFGIIIM